MNSKDNEIISNYGVELSVSLLKHLLEERKIPVFAQFNHTENARKAGLTMPETIVLVFGNPSVGTKLILERPEIAYELPLRILVWEDAEHHTHIQYENPVTMAKRYGLEEHPIIKEIQKLLLELSEKAAKGKILPYEGMNIYFLVNGQPMEGKSVQITQKEDGGTFHIEGYGSCAGPYEISFDQLHRTIFLSKEEAEQYKDNEALYLE